MELLDLLKIQGLFPNILQEGFSAFKASLTTSGDTGITDWSTAFPSFASNNFNAVTGIYTVPITGVYAIQATVNYVTTSAISTQLGVNITPSITVRKTTPTQSDLVSGLLPIFYTNLLVLSLRTILSSSSITLTDVVQLTKGDTLTLFYNSDGMSLSLSFENTQWAVYRVK